MRNFYANTISVNDVLHTLRACDRDSKYEGAFEHMLAFASELTGLSEDFLIDHLGEKQAIDFSRLSFRDYDDTGMPLQLFFGYEVSQEQREDLVHSLGYRSDGLMDFELVLDVYNQEHCPLEAVLTFSDGDVQWADVWDSVDDLSPFIQAAESSQATRAKDALEVLRGIAGEPVFEETMNASRRINREKLSEYLEDEMILEFDSAEECMDFFNTYDGQNFKSVDELKKYQDVYGFGLNGKWYHINFEQALDVWDVPAPRVPESVIAALKGDISNLRHELDGIAGYEQTEPLAERIERRLYIRECQLRAAENGFILEDAQLEDVIVDLDTFIEELEEAGTIEAFLEQKGLLDTRVSLHEQVSAAETEKEGVAKENNGRDSTPKVR